MTTEPSLDAVCVCGHPRHEHNHVDDLTDCGHFMDDDSLCECNSFLPASPSPAHDTQYIRDEAQKTSGSDSVDSAYVAAYEIGCLLKEYDPAIGMFTSNDELAKIIRKHVYGYVPAHDTPAAKLRERLAKAENANKDERDSCSQTYAILTGRRYGEGYSLRDLTNIAKAVVAERDTARAEAADLRAQLATVTPPDEARVRKEFEAWFKSIGLSTGKIFDSGDYKGQYEYAYQDWRAWQAAYSCAWAQSSALHPLADMAAGLLAEKRQLIDKFKKLDFIIPSELEPDERWRRNGEYVSRFHVEVLLGDAQPSPSPDAQEETKP